MCPQDSLRETGSGEASSEQSPSQVGRCMADMNVSHLFVEVWFYTEPHHNLCSDSSIFDFGNE